MKMALGVTLCAALMVCAIGSQAQADLGKALEKSDLLRDRIEAAGAPTSCADLRKKIILVNNMNSTLLRAVLDEDYGYTQEVRDVLNARVGNEHFMFSLIDAFRKKHGEAQYKKCFNK